MGCCRKPFFNTHADAPWFPEARLASPPALPVRNEVFLSLLKPLDNACPSGLLVGKIKNEGEMREGSEG